MQDLVKVTTEEVNAADAISGAQMAAYLRQIAAAIETSDKRFIAKLNIKVLASSH